MIIRKKNNQEKKSSKSSKSTGVGQKSSVIKKEDIILDLKNAKDTNNKKEALTPSQMPKTGEQPEEFEKIDISSIEFKERIERRRGDRRRGYRRIDERSLVSRAQQEAHSIKELAAREGYQNGLKKAQSEIDEIKQSLIEFLNMKDTMYEEFYPHIMELALEAAKKIIKKEVEISSDVLKNIIMETMDEINSDTQKVVIKVNSDDLEFAQASLPEIIETKKLSAKVTTEADDTIEKGSCILIANNGVIDANFKTQLNVLQSAFGIYKGGL